ncbi:phage GP46 family protein, partial [Escherichia coli]|uniref:phage GP46 family protein n=1 Tax=Escherichia coli TaxID=562 RepID=UPI000AF66857
MTTGIRWNNMLSRGDITVTHNGLSRDEGLVTQVLICLFTDARADDDDVIPDGSGDPRGWPGDTFSGCSTLSGGSFCRRSSYAISFS